MKIKTPPVYDISHWKTVRDFSAITPRPALMFTKATEAIPSWTIYSVDSKFVEYFKGMAQAGIPRGCYHFFRKSVDAKAQARHFVDTIKPHLTDDDILALDIEEGGETDGQIIQFCDYVQAALPKNILMIYSRKSILDLVAMTQAQKDRLRKIPVWTAGYPYFPDLFSSVPSWYIPDQTKWGSVWLWQYSETGKIEGIEGAVDLNWIDPALYDLIEDIIPPVPVPPVQTDIVTYPFDGAKQIHGVRYGRKVYINLIDLQRVRVEVRNEDNRPSYNCQKYGAQIAFNGDDWERLTRMVKDNPEPSLIVYEDGHISIGNYSGAVLYKVQHTSGLRYLVQGGVNVIPVNGTEPKYTERHARSVTGLSADGKLVHLTVDGDYPDKGMTLYECAQVMIEFGAVVAFDQGGGGDSVEVLNGNVVNVPDDDIDGTHYERKVPQTILVYSKPIQEKIMNIKGVAKPGTTSNIKPMAGGGAIATLSDGQYVYGQWSSTKSDIVNFTHYYRADGTKVELGTPCKVYVGINLITSVEEESTGTTPPPDPDTDPEPLDLKILLNVGEKRVDLSGDEEVQVYWTGTDGTTVKIK